MSSWKSPLFPYLAGFGVLTLLLGVGLFAPRLEDSQRDRAGQEEGARIPHLQIDEDLVGVWKGYSFWDEKSNSSRCQWQLTLTDSGAFTAEVEEDDTGLFVTVEGSWSKVGDEVVFYPATSGTELFPFSTSEMEEKFGISGYVSSFTRTSEESFELFFICAGSYGYNLKLLLESSNKTQHHKSDRSGESEIDWMRERGRSSESVLSRSDWVCWNVRLKSIMKKSRLAYFLILVVVAVQFLTMSVAWPIIVGFATEHGRNQRGGVGFGITLAVSAWTFILVLLLGGYFARRFPRWIERILCQMGAFIVWAGMTIVPHLSSYPNRAGGFILLCAIIYVFGTTVLLPASVVSVTRPNRGEQGAVPQIRPRWRVGD